MAETLRVGLSKIKKWIRQIPWSFAAAGFGSAVLVVLSFPPYSVWPLGFICVVPAVVALFRAKKWSDVIWTGFTLSYFVGLGGFSWMSFVATNFGGLPWIVGKIILLIFAVFGELQFALFMVLAWMLLNQLRHKPWSRGLLILIGLPLVYTGLDVVYPKIFPNTMGNLLFPWFSVVQITEFTTAYGLTFLLIAANTAFAVFAYRALQRFRSGEVEDKTPMPGVAAPALVLVLLALTLWSADRWGTRRVEEMNALEKTFTRSFKVSVIQANIGDVDKLASERGFTPAVNFVLRTYLDMSIAAVQEFHPDLVVWPETAYPYLYTHFQDVVANRVGTARDKWILDLVGEMNTALYFGTYSSVKKKDYNSAFLVERDGTLAGLYRKSILLAFGEYVPLGPFSSIVQDIVPTIADFGRGPGPTVLNFRDFKLGPQICYEGITTAFSRGSALLGAELLLNITNDSWFGDTGEPWLHLLLTSFRSIELRRPLLRATNTGISTLQGISGEFRRTSELFKPETLNLTIPLPGPGQAYPETFVLKHGEVFSGFCVLIMGLLTGLALVTSGVFKRLFSRIVLTLK